MLRLSEILINSILSDYSILCGEEYLQNEVTSVAILEYESIINHCSGFRPGQFVFASYFFASTSADIIHQALTYLIHQKVSGIALKVTTTETLPQNIIDCANENKVPIITFKTGWIEDLLINIDTLISEESKIHQQEERLHALLKYERANNERIPSTIHSIWPNISDNITVAYLSFKNQRTALSTTMYVETLSLILKQHSLLSEFHFFKLGTDILFVQTFDNSTSFHIQNFIMRLEQILRSAKLKPDMCYIGLFDQPLPKLSLDIAITRAKETNLLCRYLKKNILQYSKTTAYNLVFSVMRDPVQYNICQNFIRTVKEYDAAHNSKLFETLVIIVQTNHNFKKTAELLFSHENTVRYRFNKTLELLNITSKREDLILGTYIHMYMLDQLSKTT